MRPRLSEPVQRLVALLLLGLVLALGWAALAEPWMRARAATEARIVAALELETRALAVAARGPALDAELAALGRALAAGAEGIPGASYALAAAELQRRLRDVVTGRGGTLQSVETLPEGRVGDGLVGLRARLQADAGGLREILAALETGPTVLQLRLVGVAGAPQRGTRAAPLDAQVEILALRDGR